MSSEERQQLVERAVEEVLLPLARLCVGHGLPFAKAEELFKRAYVRAAREARRETGARDTRDVSQVAVATGMNRRDVTRISAELKPRAVLRMSPATQVLTHWLSDPALQPPDGQPSKLPRHGPAPSFEALATAVTRHVHPRSVLDELLRLGLVELADGGESVVLRSDRVVPDRDDARLFALLAANVGDHLAAATANVLQRDRRHLEQAVFSQAMSPESVQALRSLVQTQWKQLLARLVPAMEKLIEQDRAVGRDASQRVRVGLYSYHEPLPEERNDKSD
jgi:hypothetical protein